MCKQKALHLSGVPVLTYTQMSKTPQHGQIEYTHVAMFVHFHVQSESASFSWCWFLPQSRNQFKGHQPQITTSEAAL